MKTRRLTAGKHILASLSKLLEGVDRQKLAEILKISPSAIEKWRYGQSGIDFANLNRLLNIFRDEEVLAELLHLTSGGLWSNDSTRKQKHAIREIQIEDERKRRQIVGPRVRGSFGFVTFGAGELQDLEHSLERGVNYKRVISIERDPNIATQARRTASELKKRFPKVSQIKILEGNDTTVCQSDNKVFQKVAASRFNADYMGTMSNRMLRSMATTLAQSIEMAPYGVWKYGIPFAYDFTVVSARSKAENWDLAKDLIPAELRPAIEELRKENPAIANHYEKVIAVWAVANHYAQSHRVVVKLDFAYHYHEMAKLSQDAKRRRHNNQSMMIVGLKLLPPCGSLADYEAFRAQQIKDIAQFRLTAENFLGYKDLKKLGLAKAA